jgi:hypothetical protein
VRDTTTKSITAAAASTKSTTTAESISATIKSTAESPITATTPTYILFCLRGI